MSRSTSLRRVALTAAILAAWPTASRADEAPGAPVATDLANKGGTLSDKLGDANGVIHPRGDVDPEMRRPAPAGGSMPVVKPGAADQGTAK